MAKKRKARRKTWQDLRDPTEKNKNEKLVTYALKGRTIIKKVTIDPVTKERTTIVLSDSRDGRRAKKQGNNIMAKKAKKVVKKTAKKTVKKVAKKAPKKAEVGKRPVGKKWGLGIVATWVRLFKENTKLKQSDELITKFLFAEFPGRDSAIFNHVATVRTRYNKGLLTKGEVPKVASSAYVDGVKKTARTTTKKKVVSTQKKTIKKVTKKSSKKVFKKTVKKVTKKAFNK